MVKSEPDQLDICKNVTSVKKQKETFSNFFTVRIHYFDKSLK